MLARISGTPHVCKPPRMHLHTLYRAARGALRPRLPRPVLFTHIPKCGGISVDRAIRYRYRTGPTVHWVQTRDACRDLYGEATPDVVREPARVAGLVAVRQGVRYIGGHFPVGAATIREARAGGYLLITVLRDPYCRLVSSVVYNHVRHWELGLREVPEPGNVGRAYHDVLLTELLNGRFTGTFGSFFGGETPREVAERIGAYDVVGWTENMGAFEADLRTRGLDVEIGCANQIAARKRYAQQAAELRALFDEPAIAAAARQACAFDVAVVDALDGPSASLAVRASPMPAPVRMLAPVDA